MVNRGALVAQTGGDSRVSARLPDSDRSRRCSAQSSIPALDAPNSGLLAWDAPAITHRIPGGFINGYRFAERRLGPVSHIPVFVPQPPFFCPERSFRLLDAEQPVAFYGVCGARCAAGPGAQGQPVSGSVLAKACNVSEAGAVMPALSPQRATGL